MKMLVNFMNAPIGRITRVVAGSGLIAWGMLGMGDTTGYYIAAAGVVPILTGLFNICVIDAKLWRGKSQSQSAHS